MVGSATERKDGHRIMKEMRKMRVNFIITITADPGNLIEPPLGIMKPNEDITIIIIGNLSNREVRLIQLQPQVLMSCSINP